MLIFQENSIFEFLAKVKFFSDLFSSSYFILKGAFQEYILVHTDIETILFLAISSLIFFNHFADNFNHFVSCHTLDI
jgi:hypothetical protein